MDTTDYLLASKANRLRLLQAIAEFEAGLGLVRELIELEADARNGNQTDITGMTKEERHRALWDK